MAPIKRRSQETAPETRPAKKIKQAAPFVTALKEEQAFPRGGASILTPLEQKQIHIQAKQDVLFEQSTRNKATRHEFGVDENEEELPTAESNDVVSGKSKARSKGKKAVTEGLSQEKSTKIESLSYKRLASGSLVLGKVAQINRHDIALTLPNNLTGYVPLTSISKQVTKRIEVLAAGEDDSDVEMEDDKEEPVDLKILFSVGQYLRAYVASTEEEASAGGKSKRHIALSLDPRQTNATLAISDLVVNSMVQATVQSVEDHGLVMDLGFEDKTIRGFMSSKDFDPKLDPSRKQEGTVLLCLITGKSSNGKIIKLSIDQAKVGNVKKGSYLTDGPSLNAFLPGTAVDVLVSEVTETGVVGKVMGMVSVTADLIHSGAASSEKDLSKKCPVGSKVKGRIICTFPTSEEHKLGISLQDHVVYLRDKTVATVATQSDLLPTQSMPLSSIIAQARVVKVQANAGVFVDIGVKGVRGFVHISRLSDSKVESIASDSGAYKIGSTHKGRVLGYNSMDGLFIVSLEPKVIDQPFLRLEDVNVGQIVKGTIQKILINAEGVNGLLVNIAEDISGLVPETHLADLKLQHPERRFKEGNSVTARVLSTSVERRHMRLTLKKTLVNSDVEPWIDYEGLQIGMRSPGTLVNVLPSGSVVQFYGSVRAFLPVSEMSESFIQDPREHFRPGQVVTVRIVSVDPQERRMIVSCNDASSVTDDQRQALDEVKLGALVSGIVSEKTNDQIVLSLQPSGLKGLLSRGHLTDGSAAKADSAIKRLRLGQAVKDLVVLSKNESKHLIRLSNKPSLVTTAIAKKLLTSFDDVQGGAEVVGFVNNVTEKGVFVQFGGDVTGLMLKQHMPEETTLLPDFGMSRHQTVTARVLSIDHGHRKFLLTTKPIDQVPSKTNGTIEDVVLSNPVDGTSRSIDDFKSGKLTQAKVNSVKDTQLNVQLADGVLGRIDVSSIYDSWDDIKDKKHPLKKFHPKQDLSVRILGMHDSRNHRFLPISHRTKAPVFELTAKSSDLAADKLDPLTLDKVEVGSSWIVYVNKVAEDCVWVNLSPNVRGRIRAMDISNELSVLTDVAKKHPVGSAMIANVVKVDLEHNRLDLSARDSTSSAALTLQDLSVGQILPGRVTRIAHHNVMVQLSEHVSGPIHLVDMTDDYSKTNQWVYKKNQTIRVCIKDIDLPNKRIRLSCRPSQVLSSTLPIEDPDLKSLEEVRVNDIRRGFIKHIADSGILVALSSNVTAFVRVGDLSDGYIKDWQAAYELDQLVKGKIIRVDASDGHVQMSLKESHLSKEYKPPLTFNDLEVGQELSGKVRKVEVFGVFVVFDGSANVSGLCHKSQMTDGVHADPKKLYNEGDIVKAKVLNINKEKRQVSLGLKASLFGESSMDQRHEKLQLESDTEASDDSDGVNRDQTNGIPVHSFDAQSDEHAAGREVQDLNSDAETEDAENGGVAFDDADEAKPTLSTSFAGLSAGGFDWTGGLATFEEQDPPSETDLDAKYPKKKKRRKAEIKIDKTGDLDTYGPQSVADFERLLLGQPNSSVLWLQYMAFQLQLGEVAIARSIAERALKTIPMSEQDQKLNVWVALLNLENAYGTDDSVEEIFKRACQYNDSENLHERLISIHIQSDQHRKADDLFQAALKKHTQTPGLYLNYATFLMTTRNEPERARSLLPRAMQALPSHTHLDLTSKFAQLEFNSPNGDAERGRTVFETLVSQWPKRLDLWNVLLDLEMKKDDQELVRKLFERVTGPSAKLKPRKAKYFFKRWLEYEERVGDERSRERVKALAAEFVERAGKGA